MPAITEDTIEITKKLLGLLGAPTEDIKVDYSEGEMMVHIRVAEEESGVLIGYHGETLGAFQYLLGQLANRGRDNWTRVMVNINGYRDQRETQLKQMATNAADRAIASGDEIEMPYLTPSERRIIHLELSNRKDISTFSEGEGRNRRLIIAPKKVKS